MEAYLPAQHLSDIPKDDGLEWQCFVQKVVWASNPLKQSFSGESIYYPQKAFVTVVQTRMRNHSYKKILNELRTKHKKSKEKIAMHKKMSTYYLINNQSLYQS